jgi:hypothetical protein
MRKALREHIAVADQQRHQQIVGDCRQLHQTCLNVSSTWGEADCLVLKGAVLGAHCHEGLETQRRNSS